MLNGGNKKSRLDRAAHGLYLANGGVVTFCGCFLFTIISIQVFYRYILSGNINAMEEYLYFFLMWLVFCGAAAGVFDNTHLRSDTLMVLIKNKRFLNKLLVFIDILEVLLYGAFAYFSFLYMKDCVDLMSYTRVLKLPNMLGQSSVFIGSIIMLIFGIYVYRNRTKKRIEALRAYKSGLLSKYDETEKVLELDAEASKENKEAKI